MDDGGASGGHWSESDLDASDDASDVLVTMNENENENAIAIVFCAHLLQAVDRSYISKEILNILRRRVLR